MALPSLVIRGSVLSLQNTRPWTQPMLSVRILERVERVSYTLILQTADKTEKNILQISHGGIDSSWFFLHVTRCDGIVVQKVTLGPNARIVDFIIFLV